MNNYEYIIASLPVLQSGYRGSLEYEETLEGIRSQLSSADSKQFGMLLSGFDPEKLNADFYLRAEASPSRFIREYFAFDLLLRNAKVQWLNRSLGRSEETDLVILHEDQEPEPEQAQAFAAALGESDILQRERGLDELLWAKAEQITVLSGFCLDSILAFVVKLQIVHRWIALDESTGRALFTRLVKEIKENYTL